MKKYYDIGQETENIIMQLKNKCQELKLGNINFSYFADGKTYQNHFHQLLKDVRI